MLFVNVASTPLFDVDEGAFSEATRNMVATGNYLTTYLDGAVRFDKPILSYWFQSIGVAVAGVTEFAFRLPSLLATIFWVLAVGFFVARNDRPENGLPAAIITSTALGVLLIGRAATADALLNLFLVLSLFDVYRFSQTSSRRFLYQVYFWMALGMLTKGPVAVLIPLATGGLYLGLGRRFGLIKKAVLCPVGWLIFLAVAAPWYVLEYLDQGQAFIDGFFMTHNAARFTSAMEQHSGGALYYLPVIFLLMLPFSGLILPAIYHSVRQAIRRQGDRLDLFLWCWFGFVFVFFSLSGTKLPHYMIYGLVPLIILTVRHTASKNPGLWLLPPALLLIALIGALPQVAQTWFPEFSPRLVNYYQFFDYVLIVLIGLGVVLVNLWPGLQRTTRLALTGLACSACLSCWLMPMAGYLLQAPVKNAALFSQLNVSLPIVQWGVDHPSFSVYRGQPTPRRAPTFDEVALTRRSRIDALNVPYLTLFQEEDMVLIRLLPMLAEENHP